MNFIRKFRENRFIQSVITLISGSLLAQVITIIAAIMMARIYTPEELGIYTLILTAESLFGSVICLRYDVSIVSEKEDEKVFGIIKCSIYIAVISSLIVALFYGGYIFLYQMAYKKYAYAVIFIAVMLIMRGIINILDAYNNRCREYKLMTTTYVFRTIVQNIGAVILGLFGWGVLGIVISHTLGLFCGVKKQSENLYIYRNEIKKVDSITMGALLKENYRQPLYSSPAVFANRFSYSSISLFIQALYGVGELGLYSISYKALGLPLTVLSNNVSKVFFRDASREYENKGEFRSTLIKTSVSLVALAIPMGLIFYYLSPWGVKILLGEEWLPSARFVQILIPMFCIRFVVNTVAYGLQIAKKQNLELFFQGILVFFSIIVFLYVKAFSYSTEMYLKLITISFSVAYICYYLCVFKFSKKKRN